MTRYVQIEVPADLAIEDLARAACEMRCTIRISAGGLRLVPIAREPVAPIRFLPVNADEIQPREIHIVRRQKS